MNELEQQITRILIELANYVCTYGEFPPKGTLSSDGIDMNQLLYNYRNGKIEFTEKQEHLISLLIHLLSKTEWNIREVEYYYCTYGYLPYSKECHKLRKAISDFRTGKIAITESQQKRLEAIGALSTATEKTVRSIEEFYSIHNRLPEYGEYNHRYCDMGRAIVDYQNGNRLLTLGQKVRLEKIGISFKKIQVKKEPGLAIRLVEEKSISQRKINRLKKARDSFIEDLLEDKKILFKEYF
ncbi:MAG: hypothetical protein HFH31_01725 [Bacilli bacterium]|nr:hypothetical protein [Bacilli bacterium]